MTVIACILSFIMGALAGIFVMALCQMTGGDEDE